MAELFKKTTNPVVVQKNSLKNDNHLSELKLPPITKASPEKALTLEQKQAKLSEWTSNFCRFIQITSKQSTKPTLVVIGENHISPTNLAVETEMLANLNSGFFANDKGVNLYVELSEDNLTILKNSELKDRNTCNPSILVPIADGLGYNVIAADKLNSGDLSDNRIIGDLFDDRDRAMKKKVLENVDKRNGILICGALHVKNIVTDPELSNKYTVIPVMLCDSNLLSITTWSSEYMRDAARWYDKNNVVDPENRLSKELQDAYPKPDPLPLMKKNFPDEKLLLKILRHLAPEKNNLNDKELMKAIEHYSSNLHNTFGSVYLNYKK
jgi:hypothetical protein